MPRKDALRVVVVGMQSNGIIHGKTAPFAEVLAVNLSTAPSERVRPIDVIVIARADARGRFSGKLPLRLHDLVRMRARTKNGLHGKSMTFRARGLLRPPRPPYVATFRLGLRDLGNGTIRVFNINPARPIAEPGAELSFTNSRTSERVSIVMNAVGSLKGRVRVSGRAGDELVIEILQQRRPKPNYVGTLLTPSPTKPQPKEHGEGGFVSPSGFHQKIGFVPTLHRFRAPLFRRRPNPYDVYQSELSNCYIASAVAAIAHVSPSSLERAIRHLGDGRYRVQFKISSAKKARPRRYLARNVVVTSHLYVRPSGHLLYGSTAALSSKLPSLWWPVLEKAFARLKGSYKKIGRGGCSHHILEMLLGRPSRHFFSDQLSPDDLWRELTTMMNAGLPLVVGTFPTTSARKYRHTGLYPDHAYTVLSCREVKGRRMIGLRNPWGEDVAKPGTPRKNGYFELAFDQFVDLIEVISTVR